MAAMLMLALLAAQTDLGPVLAFDAPRTCGMGAPLRTIAEGLQVTPEGSGPPPPIQVPGLAAPLRPAIVRYTMGTQIRTVITVVLQGRWLGLRVDQIDRMVTPGAPGSSLRISFEERPDRVLTALNAAGFDLGPPGSQRDFQTENGRGRIGVTAGRRGSLVCEFE